MFIQYTRATFLKAKEVASEKNMALEMATLSTNTRGSGSKEKKMVMASKNPELITHQT